MRRQFIKLTADDVSQMSDSQRIMFDAGRLFELDRIIKLLEKQMDDCCGYSPSECFTHSTILRSIDLVKGGK